MSFTKLNKLHLSLTNDEGWRLEIPGLPELTGFGSKRAFDLQEKDALHQGMGSVDLAPGDGISGKARNETEANLGRRPAYQGYEQSTVNFVGQGSGHYSVRDFEDILRYAAERHVEVIPELNFRRTPARPSSRWSAATSGRTTPPTGCWTPVTPASTSACSTTTTTSRTRAWTAPTRS